MLETGVCLDVCPTSNLMSRGGADPGGPAAAALLAAGVVFSVNADDQLLFGTSLLGEYELFRNVLGLGDEQLAAITRASLLESAAPRAVVGKGLAGIDAG